MVGNGDGTFNPQGNAERQQVALVASSFLDAKDSLTKSTPNQPQQQQSEPTPTPAPEPTGTSGSSSSSSGGSLTSAQTVAAPTASPAGGAVPWGTAVMLGTTTVGADVYYTTDGSVPTVTGAVYHTPILITPGDVNRFTISFLAARDRIQASTQASILEPGCSILHVNRVQGA